VLALLNRPELAAERALIQGAVDRLRQERFGLIPERAAARRIDPCGRTLAGLYSGAGTNSTLEQLRGRASDFAIHCSGRSRTLGFGPCAGQERKAETSWQ